MQCANDACQVQGRASLPSAMVDVNSVRNQGTVTWLGPASVMNGNGTSMAKRPVHIGIVDTNATMANVMHPDVLITASSAARSCAGGSRVCVCA